MKKLIIITCVVCLLLSACGGSDTNSTTSAETTIVAEAEATEETTEEETDAIVEETITEETTEAETAAPKEELPEVQVGETITIDDVCEFTIEYSDITSVVYPPAPSGYYSYYEADSGMVYVDICVAYKNLATNNLSADKALTATLTFDDKYTYTGFDIIEKSNRSDFTYTNITSIAPLTTEYLHYLFKVPDVVDESNASIVITLIIDAQKYNFVVRDGSEAVDYSVSEENTKASGNIIAGEWVTVPGTCDFAVEYSDIADVINPPAPTGYYRYYEADDGKTYVDVSIEYKNLGNSNIRADKALTATLLYDDNYKYTGFDIIESDNRGDFTYTNITNIAPLTTEYLHYLFDVPEEVGETDKPIVVTITIDNNNYDYKVR